jgi:hypothetical protein
MARQALRQIAAETDAGRLQEMLAEIEQAAAQGPLEMKGTLELTLKRASERLAALQGEEK